MRQVIEESAPVLDRGVQKTTVVAGRRGDGRQAERVGREDGSCVREARGDQAGRPPSVAHRAGDAGERLKGPRLVRQALEAGLHEIAAERRRPRRAQSRSALRCPSESGAERQGSRHPVTPPHDVAEK
jgi:hypothetical protein